MAAATPEGQGHLDTGTSETLSGWAWNPNDPVRTVDVEVHENGAWLATVPADRFGADLLAAGIGDGRHRFLFRLPPSDAGTARLIDVRVAGTGVHLGGSPLTLPPADRPLSAAAFRGHLDRTSEGVVSGWAWDASRPDTPVFVDIFEGTQLLATVPADVFGKDLVAAGIGNGRHRFEFVTPRRLRARRDQRVHVQFSGTGVALTGSPVVVERESLAKFAHGAPSAQTAIDIFKGDWISRFPETACVSAGAIGLFEDPRIAWALGVVGDLHGQQVVELGPLEGAHTCMLAQRGATVVAVEGNRHNYLKCLVAREVVGFGRATFLHGDIVEFLRQGDQSFDLCLASGVLYHMENPAGLIAAISRRARRLVLWTHYYDAALCAQGVFADNFVGHVRTEFEDFVYTQHQQEYGDVLFADDYCGGTRPTSNWMSREDILACLAHFGFGTIREIGFEDRVNPRGPSFCVVAEHGLADSTA